MSEDIKELRKQIEALQQELNAKRDFLIATTTRENTLIERIAEKNKQIEALQQEYDELDTGHSKLFKAFCEMKQEAEQLQAQAAQYREAVEVLETVTEHLENCYGRNTPDTEKAREVLAAIDKIGGREDV